MQWVFFDIVSIAKHFFFDQNKKFKGTRKRDLLLLMNLHSGSIWKSASYVWFAGKIREFPKFFSLQLRILDFQNGP